MAKIQASGSIDSAVFSPDGQYVAMKGYVAMKDGDSGWIWDWKEGRALAEFHHRRGLQSNISDIRFTPDGSRIVTTGYDGIARLWAWRVKDLVADACSRLERNLSKEEWRTYLGDEPYRETCPGLPVPAQ